MNFSHLEGFRTPDGGLVHSVRYRLECSQSQIMDLWIPVRSDGHALNGLARPFEDGKRMVDVRPGERIWFKGKTYRVADVDALLWNGAD